MLPVRKLIVIGISIFALVVLLAPLKAADNYVGVEGCKVCHPAQYAAWKAGPHAQAFNILESDRKNDPKCLGCHATKAQDDLMAVQCESCHGAGAHYARSYIMKDRKLAEAVGLVVKDFGLCLKCHQGDLPSVEVFDPKTFWKRLPHSKTNDPAAKQP